MLYHVTTTHSPDNCPLYDSDLQEEMRQFTTNAADLAREVGVTIHFLVTAAPDHVFYSLLETDNFTGILRVLGAMPLRQEFTITPVSWMQEAMEILGGE